MEVHNHRQKFDVTKRFTSGKLRTLSGAKPPQFALPRADSKLTFNSYGDVHLYCLFFSLIFVMFPPERQKCKSDENVRRFLEDLRWLERVFKCYKPFETRKDYKDVFLSMWAIYEYLDNSFLVQYFKAGCDVIAVTMTTLIVHKKKPQI